MLKDLIRIQLSTKELTYQPGGIPATFEIAMRSVTLETVDPTDPAAATAAAVAKAIAASQKQSSGQPSGTAPPRTAQWRSQTHGSGFLCTRNLVAN